VIRQAATKSAKALLPRLQSGTFYSAPKDFALFHPKQPRKAIAHLPLTCPARQRASVVVSTRQAPSMETA
jgi:hypothetical protein